METLYDVLWFTTAKQSVTNLNLIRTWAVITVSVTARQSTAVDACWGSVGGFGYRITLLKWQGSSWTAGGHAVAKHTWEAWGGCLIADSDNLNALSERWILNLLTNLFQWLLQAYLWLVSSCCLGSEILKIKGEDFIEAYKVLLPRKHKKKNSAQFDITADWPFWGFRALTDSRRAGLTNGGDGPVVSSSVFIVPLE